MQDEVTREQRGGLFGWLDRRYGLQPLIDFAKHKEVPVGTHSMVWYYLGGATLFFFTVQIVSGVLLLMYYQPGRATSWESIHYITTKVPFGWLIRSVHCWSAHLMIVSLVAHMFSTMMLKAYRPPRELTWVTGFILLSIALGFGFSGYLLPWNQLAFFATAVGTDSVKSVPVIGNWLVQVLRGGTDVSINTLYRFFAFHVVVLPLVIGAIIGIHILLIQRQGMAPPMGEKKAPRGIRFFPNFAMRDVQLWLVCLIALVTLAVFVPYGPHLPGIEWELGHKANPLAAAYPGIKPEWYFLWIYQLLKEFPSHLFGMEGPQAAILLVSILMGVWALVPWLDRRAARGESSPGFTDFGVAVLLFLGFLMLMAWDIGGTKTGPNGLPNPADVAWTASLWILGAGALITVVRIVAMQHRWFIFSFAEMLHAALHGIAGVPYLLAGVIAAALAGCTIAIVLWRERSGATAPGGQG